MSEATKLQKSLFNDKRNGWADLSEEKKNEIYNYCNSYMEFLNNGKTEREIVKESKNIADSNGFKNIEEVESLKPGDKVYYINKKKAMNKKSYFK